MLENTIFSIILVLIILPIIYFLNIPIYDPRFVLVFIFILLIPGFYAAYISGPFVPSNKKRHKTMIELAELKDTDNIVDIGCGDGRLVFSSAPYAKKAVGYELSIPLFIYAKFISLFKKGKIDIRFGNIWKQKYDSYDVVFCYLLPKAMKRFYKEIWPSLKKGTRVVSNSFQISYIKPIKSEEHVYLYVK